MAIKYWVGAKAFVYNKKLKKFLTIKRSYGDTSAGMWENPGGKKEINEDIRDTLKRELLEETGIVVEDYRMLYASSINEERNPFMIIGFLVVTEQEKIELSYEHIEYRWVDKEELFTLIDRGMKKDFIEANIESIVKEYD